MMKEENAAAGFTEDSYAAGLLPVQQELLLYTPCTSDIRWYKKCCTFWIWYFTFFLLHIYRKHFHCIWV